MAKITPASIVDLGRRMMADVRGDIERNGSPQDALEGAARMAIIMARYPHEVWLTHLLYTNHLLIHAASQAGHDLGSQVVQVETHASKMQEA